MNGRVYDYNLGRFTGVDPVIQFPLNSQSLNPNSYILNNPLSGTDPTGYACTGSRTEGEGGCTVGGGFQTTLGAPAAAKFTVKLTYSSGKVEVHRGTINELKQVSLPGKSNGATPGTAGSPEGRETQGKAHQIGKSSDRSNENGPAGRLNSELGTSVLGERLSQFEGRQRLNGYVPNNHGVVIGNSGVTIATGFDIGQLDQKGLASLQLGSDLTTKLAPYTDIRLSPALAYLNLHPLSVSRDEANDIDYAVQGAHLRAAITSWNMRRPNGQPSFNQLSPQQQTVLLSRTYHQGPNMPNSPVARDFYNAALNGDWTRARTALQNYHVSAAYYINRVHLEAGLLGEQP
jgi:hypothetical protein